MGQKMSSVKGGKANDRSRKSGGGEYGTEESGPVNTAIQEETCQELRVWTL